MVQHIKFIAIALTTCLLIPLQNITAQVSTGTNAISAGDYVGSSTSVDVDNVTQQNQNINFYTNGGTSYPWTNKRMSILANGNVGIGNLTPTSPFHTQYSATGLTSGFTANFFENLATSSTNGVNKLGLEIQSTGSWSGSSSINTGLRVNVSGGTTNYSGLFTGGNLGLENTTPIFKLTIGDNTDINSDGGILAFGSTNALFSSGITIPSGLTVPRMIWYPKKAAFRAGRGIGSDWDDINMGLYSAAFGYSTHATGEASFAVNHNTSATGKGAFTAGFDTDANGDYTSAFGDNSIGTAYAEMVLGRNNLPCVGCDALFWQDTDPIFEIGNGVGQSGGERNILTVLKDGRTGLGLATFPPLTDVQLHVERKTDAVAGTTDAEAGYFDAENTWNSGGLTIGIIGIGRQQAGSTCSFLSGGRFFAAGYGGSNQGVFGWAYGAKNSNYGGYFQATISGAQPPLNVGVYGTASRALFNYGVHGYTQSPTPGATNYAIYGDLGVPACPGFPPTPCGTAPDYAGYFNGDVISLTNIFLPSDANLKDNIQDLVDPMNIISQLNPKSYIFKQADNVSMNLANGTHYGFLAQEVENVLPQLVKNSVHPARYDSLGNETHAPIDFKAINYIELIPFLTAAIKEQQQVIESMQAAIATLYGGNYRNANPGTGDEENPVQEEGNEFKSINVNLSNSKSIVLNQNVPNPFAEQTTISFYIPDNAGKVQIFFYDIAGTILRIVDVTEKGAGKLNVFASDLSSGNYTYTLIADGKVIETKKMIKQ